MKQGQKTLLTIILPVVIVIGGLVYLAKSSQPGGEGLEAFAQCLTEKGSTFYGAYWCPHCQDQKKLFGNALKYVDYVECGIVGNTSAQVQECTDADITSYPTWTFGDGTRQSGLMPLRNLADKTGCELPVETE